MVKYVSNIQSNQDAELKPLLRSVPVWPTIKSNIYVTAANALATKTSRLLVSWTRDYERFIKPGFWHENEALLKALSDEDIHDIDLLIYRILPTLPDRLSTPQEKSCYDSFIMALSKMENRASIRDDLRRSKLAPDRAGVLHTAEDLLEHDNVIFASAFRNTAEEDSKFLLKEVEKFRGFWVEIGLSRDRQEKLRDS